MTAVLKTVCPVPRRLLLAVVGAVGAVLAVASLALACTSVDGSTTITSPSSKSGTAGSTFIATGTNGFHESPYTLNFLPSDRASHGHSCHSTFAVAVGSNVSDSNGDIGPTTGVVPAGAPEGASLVCFEAPVNLSVMRSDTFTVIGGV